MGAPLQAVRESYFLQFFWKNPVVLTMFRSFSSGSNLYIVTEYCEQGDLRSFLQKNPEPLSPTLVAKFLCELLVGVRPTTLKPRHP